MADDKKTVQIDIVADAKQFKQQLKETAKQAKEFSQNSQNLNKVGVKQDKALQKVNKDFVKFNKAENTKAIQMEKQLQSVMKQKSNILKELHKQGKVNSEEFKKEQKALKETASLYSDIKKNRSMIFGNKDAEKGRKDGSSTGKMAIGSFIGNVGAQAFGAVVGAIKGRITDAVDAANEYNAATIQSLGDKDFDKGARSRARGAGNVAGFTATEVMQQAAAVVRQTGRAEDAGTSLQLSRAAMIDQGKAAGFMGVQARGGVTGATAKKEQEKIIAAGFASGIQRGRFGEFIQGVAGLAEAAQGRTAGAVGAGQYAGLLAALGKTGKAGLQGARGAQVLQQLEQGVMAPGGGEAGQSLVLRSKGFGVPGGSTSYYDALKRQQMGFAGERGAGELKSFIEQLQVEFGKGSEAAALAGSNVTGVSIPIMEEVMKLVNNFSGDSKDLKKQIGELTKESLPLEEQVRDILDDEIAESLKIQVEMSNTLVRQGQALLPISLELKQLINTLVTKLVDIVIPVLETIRDIIKDTYNFFTRNSFFEDIKKEGKVEVDKIRAIYGDNPEGMSKAADFNLRAIENTLKSGAVVTGQVSEEFIKILQKQKEDFLDLKDEANTKLGMYDTKAKPFDSRGASRSLSSKEIEDAVAKGTARGSQNNQTTVNVPAPVVKNTIISTDGSVVQHR